MCSTAEIRIRNATRWLADHIVGLTANGYHRTNSVWPFYFFFANGKRALAGPHFCELTLTD